MYVFIYRGWNLADAFAKARYFARAHLSWQAMHSTVAAIPRIFANGYALTFDSPETPIFSAILDPFTVFVFHRMLCFLADMGNISSLISSFFLSRKLPFPLLRGLGLAASPRLLRLRQTSSLFMYSFFFGDPHFYGFFHSSGQVALSPAKPLDGLEPKLFFQFIWDVHTDSAHFNHQTFLIFYTIRTC